MSHYMSTLVLNKKRRGTKIQVCRFVALWTPSPLPSPREGHDELSIGARLDSAETGNYLRQYELWYSTPVPILQLC